MLHRCTINRQDMFSCQYVILDDKNLAKNKFSFTRKVILCSCIRPFFQQNTTLVWKLVTRSIGYTSCCTSSIACVCKWQQILVMVFYFFSKFQYKSQTFLRCMSRCSPMLMNSLEVHRVSQGFTEFHRVSTNVRRIMTEIRISADENRVSHGLCRASCRQHLLKIGASSHTLCTSMQRRCQRSGGSGTLPFRG